MASALVYASRATSYRPASIAASPCRLSWATTGSVRPAADTAGAHRAQKSASARLTATRASGVHRFTILSAALSRRARPRDGAGARPLIAARGRGAYAVTNLRGAQSIAIAGRDSAHFASGPRAGQRTCRNVTGVAGQRRGCWAFRGVDLGGLETAVVDVSRELATAFNVDAGRAGFRSVARPERTARPVAELRIRVG